MSLMPCFNADQAQAEGVVVGRLLAGYGELELQLCGCRVAVENILDLPIREFFGVRGAERRLDIAKQTLEADYAKASLTADLAQALSDLDWCRAIRKVS
jgi:hypothetical protein